MIETVVAKVKADVLNLIRKHVEGRRTETVGGWWRPFDMERDLGCFKCVVGQDGPFWDELWQYLEQYGTVDNFRSDLFCKMQYGCDTGRPIGRGEFLNIIHYSLLHLLRGAESS
jgi:hypothetical protein